MWKDIKLKYIFDLKGSLINRESKLNMIKHKASTTLKDINLLSIRKAENLLKFSMHDRNHIIQILEKDVAVLKRHKIMDYSLLLAVEKSQITAGMKDRRETNGSNISSTQSEATPKIRNKMSMKMGMTKEEKRLSNVSEHISSINSFFIPSRHR